jgi:hypothetical protein
MKIFELFESAPPVVSPGNVVAPVGPGVKPSGDIPVANTQQKPNTSNTPKTPPPAITDPKKGPLQPNANGDLAQPMGSDPSQSTPQQQQQTPPGQQNTAQPAQAPLTAQDLQTQMQAIMSKLQQIQGQSPPPESLDPKPGVSG